MMITTEKLNAIVDEIEHRLAPNPNYFGVSYAKKALVERILDECSMQSCAGTLVNVFGKDASTKRSVKEIVDALADEIDIMETNDIYKMIGTWKGTMSVLIFVL